jgi:hypothetical protein
VSFTEVSSQYALVNLTACTHASTSNRSANGTKTSVKYEIRSTYGVTGKAGIAAAVPPWLSPMVKD